MVQISALAQSIEDELNGNINAVAMGIKFKIYSTIGNYKKATTNTNGKKQVYVNGILRATNGTYTPVKSLNNMDATLMLELAVQQERVEDIQLILSTWTESVVGEVYTMGNWAVLITPQTSIAGIAKNASPIGSMIPLMLMLDVQFIQNGLVSNSVTWSINGATVNPTSVATTNSRSPDTNPRANLSVTKNVNLYDTETIVMTLPISFSTIIQDLLDDIRGHAIDTVYRIKRQDGFSDGLDDLYILSNAELMEESGKIAAMTLTFNLADLNAQSFTLSFNSNGGNTVVSKEVYNGRAIGGLTTPRKAGYTFDGWYVDGNLITPDTIFTYNENKTAVANWYSTGLVFTYMNNDDAYMVGKNNQEGSGVSDEWAGGHLSIPTKYQGKYVTKIGRAAFRKYDGDVWKDFNITSVSLPSNLVEIEGLAFEHTAITTLTLPNTLTAIGEFAFAKCSSLTTATLPSGLETIEEQSFSECSSLATITWPTSLVEIKRGAFAHCTSLTSITFPSSLEKIGASAFGNCTNLATITWPTALVEINEYAFEKCTALTSITFPSSLKKIGTGAFYQCTNLTSITLPNGLTQLYASAFASTGLITVDIPSTVAYAGGGIFADCYNMTRANIYTTSVTKVTSKQNAWFKNMSLGGLLTIPSSVVDPQATYGQYWRYSYTAGQTDYYINFQAVL